MKHQKTIKKLKGFEKIMLKKGESKTVSFTISANDLKFYDNNLNYKTEAGEFELMIGTDSEDLKKVNFMLK